jgi:hypothetical protein
MLLARRSTLTDLQSGHDGANGRRNQDRRWAGTVATVSTGTLVATEAPDVGREGAVATLGTLAAIEAADGAARAGAVRWVAVLKAAEAPDTAAIVGTAITSGRWSRLKARTRRRLVA